MAGWIGQQKKFGRDTVHLIQCDLSNHSAWFQDCRDQGFATEAKKDLAKTILKTLRSHGFDEVYWRGDGGAYAALARPEISGAHVVRAARALRESFERWQSEKKFEVLDLGNKLALRVSCHTCPAWIGPDPGYWSSTELNFFLKHERDIAHAGTIAITHVVAADLRELRDDFGGYLWKDVDVVPGGKPWRIYYDKRKTPRGVENAVDWFTKNFSTKQARAVSGDQLFSIGEAAILHLSPRPEESIDVLLEREEVREPKFGDLEKREDWKKQEKKLREQFESETSGLLRQTRARQSQKELLERMDRIKYAPTGLRLPLKDFPLARIRYTPVLYSTARSFATVLENDQALWRQLVERGADYQEENPRRPGLLHTNTVVFDN